MKLRFLLFFILVFLLGSFSVKAQQDLVYNGEVEIEIRLNKISGRYIHDNDSWAECRLRFWKNDVEQNYVFGSGIKIDKSYWQDFDHDYLPGYWLYKKKVKLSGKTLVDYYSDSDYTFSFKGWEHDGGNSSDKHVQYGDFSVKSLLEYNNSPGWHTKTIESAKGSDAHSCWRIELEYYITPPSVEITSPSKDDTSFQEGSIVPLKVVKPEGANFEYEWMVQIDGATTTEKTERKVLAPFFFYEYGESFPWISAIGREPEDGYNLQFYSNMSREEIWNVTQYVMFYLKDDPSDNELEDMIERYLIDETIDIPYFVPAIDSKTKSNITNDGTCDYLLPESNKFYRNFKFRVQTIVRTDDKADLRCIEEDKIVIIDVFPHYPIIKDLVASNISCHSDDEHYQDLEPNQKDGSVSFSITGDVGVGVDFYQINVTKLDPSGNYTINRYSEPETANSVIVSGLDEGEYKIVVSNYFNKVDPRDVNQGVPFMVGDGSATFSIGNPKALEIMSRDVVNKKICDQYEITNIVGEGGIKGDGYKYSFVSDEDFSAGPLLLDVSSVENNSDFNYSLWIKDDNGCLAKKEYVKKRNIQLDLELKIIDNVECFGEKGSVNIRAVGGVEPYTLINETNGKSLTQGTIAGFNAGTNDISITDDEGCSFEKPIVLNEPQKIEVYDFVNVKQYDNFDIKCHGASDGKVKFKVKGGLANGPDGKPNKYSYTISGQMNKSGDNLPPATDITLEGLEAGNYTLEISDANGCSLGTLFPFELKQPDVITIKNPEPKYINSIKDKFHFSCSDASEDISIEIHGGLPPYSATHSSSLIPIEKVGAVYKAKLVKTKEVKPILYVSDKGCINKKRSVDLIKPLPLTVNFECSTYKAGPEDGTGEIYHIKKNGDTDKLNVIIEGGITPYTINFQKYDDKSGVWKLVENRPSNLSVNTFNVTAGTYKAIVNGKYPTCIQENAITIKEPAKLELPITYYKTNGYDIACKDSIGAITVKPTGGIPPYALTVNGGVSLSFSNLVSVDKYISKLPAGTYDLLLTDFHKTEFRDSIVLIEPKELTLDLTTTTYEGGYQIKCSDLLGYVDAKAGGGIGTTYNLLQTCKDKSDVFKEDINTETVKFIGLDKGYYTYKLTDKYGCVLEKSIDISKPEELKINFGAIKIPSCNEFDMGDQSKKEDGQIELTISGGAMLGYKTNIYQSDGVLPDVSKVEVNGNSPVFNSLVEGEYKFITIDGNGCKVEETKKKLEQPDLLTLDVSKMMVTEPTCFDYSDGHWESKILGGTTATGQYTYEINGVGGSTGSTFNRNNLASGKYVMEISDDNGCYYKLEKELKEPDFIINQLEVLGIDILKDGGVANFDCFGSEDGSTITVNGGTANYTVQINKEGTLYQELLEVAEGVGVSAKDLGAGSYSILTTDKRGCQSDKIDFELKQPEEIEFNRDEAKYIDEETKEVFDYTCLGASETIGVSVKGGFAPYQITYNGETKEISESEGYVDFNVFGTKPVFYIVDAKNCPKEYKPTLKEPLELQLELFSNHYGEDYQIKCFAGTDSIWAKATGGITPYKFELLDESNTLIATKLSNDETFFEDLPAGFYHVKVTGAYNNDCFTANIITLNQPEALNADIELSNYNGFEIKCNGLTDTIKVEALGGISPYTIHLKGMVPEEELTEIGDEQIEEEFTEVKNGQVIFSDLPAGEYQVSITDKFKACEYLKDTVLTEPTALKFDIETSHYEGGFEIRCSYLKDSVRITPYEGIPITNSSKYKIVQSDEDENHQLGNIVAGEDLVFKNLEAGMYTYIVSDDNGCSVSNVVTLVKPDSLQITGIDFTMPTCHEKDMGDISKRTDGEIKVQATGGVSYSGGYYDFLLNKMSLSDAKDRLDSIRAISNTTFIQRETGEYIVEVTDANACRIVRSKLQLNQADWLHIENFNSVIPECYEAKDGFWTSEVLGGTSTSGNYSFIISKDEQDFRNGTTGKEWNQDGLGKGKYLLEITDDLGCYYKQEEELLQPAEMAIDFDVMGVTNFGSNDGAVQARVSGGNGDYRYQWYHKGEKYSNGTLKKIEELYAGEYTVEIWDKNNCPYGNNEFGVANGLKKTAGVMEPGGKLSIVANPVKTSYFGAADGVLEVSAVGGWPYAVWPGYEFSLNQGTWVVTSKFENLKAGLYQLRVKDSKGVKDSIEVVIEEPDEILMELEKSNCLCFNDESGSVRVSATGGTAPYTYAINYAVDFSKSNEFADLKAGNYRVFVKDKLGNIQNQYIDVDEPENLKVELSDLTHSTCNSSNGSVKIEITGGTPEYYINWGDFYPANQLQPNTLAAGNYQIEVTDANSCAASQSFSIGEESGPEISLIDLKEVSCHESTDGEISIEITNGTEPYDAIWKGLESLNPREIKQLGKGKYSLVVNDANNCFAEAEYEITGPEELELYVSSLQSPNCVGIDDGSILLTAVGGSPDYNYNLNGKSNSNGWFPNLGAGDLQIEVTDANACKKALEAELSAPVPVSIQLPNKYVLCKNQTEIVSSGVNGVLSEWFFGENQFSTNNEVELSEEGDYRLVVTTEKGCEAEHEFAITFLDYEVVADFIIPVEAIVGDTIVAVDISWEQPDSVKWHFPDGLEVVKKEEASIWLRVLKAGNHTIGMSIFKNECSDYMEKQVRVESSSTKRKAGFIQPDQVYITEAKLYPNPNRGDLHLKLLLSKTADVSLEIYDVERALKIDTDEGHNNAVYQFDFNNRSIFRPNNVYAVVIIVGKERRVLRFLVY
ncbi:hypothetical protein BZG01_12545 [Labilibaculum manganireducens]|uniref:Secretion system C-terminal sorting domain-containing protein n=1 Tax=Labilibaculum manganireducens TaxID=1940525 RepID=A0A2N3I6R5_9BACT|nr:SprB repeat-containing protein [Labilibaculum manganireducens]PKQ65987.1 hypothetical protein BZG01_12545 [Labilibaculum manganireducens]